MKLFAFGLGYTTLHFIERYRDRFSSVAGTVRSSEKAAALAGRGIAVRIFSPDEPSTSLVSELAEADAVLISVPPDEAGDPVLRVHGAAMVQAPNLRWIGYLSTIGVYGDHGGAWVDETSATDPVSERSRLRLRAERAWLDLGSRSGRSVQIFRLAGIYGPGRNALVNLARGTAQRVIKPGQVFNRIHVADIAAVLMASMKRPRPGAIYNVADDEPAPAQDVVAFAASLAGIEPPPETPFSEAGLGPMAASFYAENKRASNRLIKEELNVSLAYPTYREGLRALHAAGEAARN